MVLEKAIVVAVEAHAGQVGKDGRPYILHPLHLMLQMETEVEMITAVLHDVVEDTAVTFADLETMGFSMEALAALRLLTHEDGVSYEAYVAAIKPHPLARRVKLADLEHNMDTRRIPHLQPKDLARLEKYHLAWEMLQE